MRQNIPHDALPRGLSFNDKGRVIVGLANCIRLVESQDWDISKSTAHSAVFLGRIPWDQRQRALNNYVVGEIRRFLLATYGLDFREADIREACLRLARADLIN